MSELRGTVDRATDARSLTTLADDSLDLPAHGEIGPEAFLHGMLSNKLGSLVGAMHRRCAEDEPPN